MNARLRAVAIVIPFFQRERGILQRALDSVAAQEGIDHLQVDIVVVDDGSPLRARDEIRGSAHVERVTVIEQDNAGPGAARNAGLDVSVATHDVIAFLDSDDSWRRGHLASAIAALSMGADVYFSNHFQLGADVAAFERRGRLSLDGHEALDDRHYLYRGDMMEQILIGNLIGTSTVAYRTVPRLRDLRFLTEFRRAGEDYLMWLDLAARDPVFAFGVEPSVDYGRGVNVFAGVQWGSAANIQRTTDELRFLRCATRRYALTPPLLRHVEQRIRDKRSELRRSLVSAMIHDPVAALRHIMPAVAAYGAWDRRS